jgi:hypothetical protein
LRIGLGNAINQINNFQKNIWKRNYKTSRTFDSNRGSHVNFKIEVEHPRPRTNLTISLRSSPNRVLNLREKEFSSF